MRKAWNKGGEKVEKCEEGEKAFWVSWVENGWQVSVLLKRRNHSTGSDLLFIYLFLFLFFFSFSCFPFPLSSSFSLFSLFLLFV